ncbi:MULTISPECIES: N-acetyltransferase [Halobacterium]|uniref:GNAT family acetyltransferase n=4 Tax=Halobacterium salinarum TaxID=2242 RepID=A0A510N761_HALSA|nr:MULTISPECIES: N-acetyltransferase [Halobacterium]MBB6088766.1 ribosomal protein S18 acetylase RimI-like enzyme [Halobacterium salinarum]MCF2206334.1 GNAT family N-acetyltransferase [Halobacterium salinarum]MCF2240024.1 GNAT family N-acetyltransferase [Halobacterium salinarum]MDL0119123.1 N-acetyltransferase [Halobacterium salinarum]MDL0122384.1 N-acetyltransferase [Halobacterium salinarum]
MSVTVDKQVVPPGSGDYLEAAWALKEHIREHEGLLKQRRGFFANAYRRAAVHCFLGGGDDELVGFAAARSDGYILFLAVAPDYRGENFGEQLVASVAADAGKASCHARMTNENAIGFYRNLGFTVEREIEDYYEDGTGAYYLRLGDHDRIRDRISELLRGGR